MIQKLFTLIILSFLLCCSMTKGQNKSDASNNKTISKYLKKVSRSSKLPQNKFYYVTKESDPEFLKKIRPSVITFVKGDKTAIIDSLKLPQDASVTGLNSSCGLDDITTEVIEFNLKSNANVNYDAISLKNLENGDSFTFPKDKIISVMLYSKKMWLFARQYANTVKRLKEEYGIDYIIITMDGTELKDLDDIFLDSFNTKSRVKID